MGVGTGLSIPVLAKDVEITGIDISQEMLIRARDRVDRLGTQNVELLKMDATQLEFPDNSFDRILAACFISTVPNPVQVVQEMKRVCRPVAIWFSSTTSSARCRQSAFWKSFFLLSFA